MPFTDIVHEAVAAAHEHKNEKHGAKRPEELNSIVPIPEDGTIPEQGGVRSRPASQQYSHSNYRDSPSARTGPPRTLSFAYPSPVIPSASSRTNTSQENGDVTRKSGGSEDGGFPFEGPDFRGVLENPDWKGKKRESRLGDESWNPLKWLVETPREDRSHGNFWERGINRKAEDDEGKGKRKESEERDAQSVHGEDIHGFQPLKRFQSTPQSRPGIAKWSRLKSMLPSVVQQNAPKTPGHSAVTPQAVNITDELMVGGLSTLMLRMWFERDEKDHRRIPVLFHRLRIRISDSINPMHGSHSVFRIECEYANGAARWVIYRQLRDFISLHTHYRVSNAYFRNVESLPEFPKTSLPYLKFLKKESREKGGEVRTADFARMQREVLENYLIDLIRAVMFHPSSNRLAGFFEISALFISLAQSGGSQYKAGYLRIEASGNKGGGFGRKSTSWREKKEPRWCAVRESYLVVLEESGSLDPWDVFLIDSDFNIERPTRYYRQGLNILHPEKVDKGRLVVPGQTNGQEDNDDRKSVISSVGRRISNVFRRSNEGNSVVSRGRVNSTSSAGMSMTSSSSISHQPTQMLDPSTNTNPLEHTDDHGNKHYEDDNKQKRKDVSKHTFYIVNSQMRLKLFARNERQMMQWITALEKVAAKSHYTGSNRFASFAPIRLNVAAQWLVDGRDYFWNLSRAILLARESIYIHDWWISPELQMRRPGKDKYRLDRLLERKAKEGVKIYIIIYQEVSSRTTPIESSYAKQRLTALHPNIMVQRSPSHFQTGTFYWAHHEKLCVIDEAIAFMGGLDLCFGRWDTAQHVLVDDPDVEGPDTPEFIWTGKDYSNPRIADFYNLNKPEEDMYDRSKVPRMPWHDIGMQVVGQPARDLARHFVERWNYLLRIKNHSRAMPFLLPPSEFKPGELTQMGLMGTCEMQICRSAGPWSLGTPGRIEHSIQNAYLKAIQLSEHFVYIENQFFITSTVVNEVKVENKIGDALVERIVRAHRENTPWKCCIIIPLIPGFAYPVDHSDASAIRIILECQNRTLFRGPNSIFARVRKEGINPDEYIAVFALRNWAKLRGEVLTTEQVYIHGKICIVDDRLAIIGSANVNERSQRGDRDSELAAVIRDTDMIDCTMAGKPFKVGRFAHTLRVRLMREHIGVDVDGMHEEDLMSHEPATEEYRQEAWDPDVEQLYGKAEGVTRVAKSKQRTPAGQLFRDTLDGVEQAIHGTGDAGSKDFSHALRKIGIKSKRLDSTAGDAALDEERTMYARDGTKEPGFASAIVPTLEEKTIIERKPQKSQPGGSPIAEKVEELESVNKEQTDDSSFSQAHTPDGQLFGAPAGASRNADTDDQPPHARSGVNDADEEEQAAPGARVLLRKHLNSRFNNPWTLPTPTPKVDPDGFEDPVTDKFWKNVWLACAVHNTEIYRKVFHAIPDDLVTTWKQYKEFVVHHERMNKPFKEDLLPEPIARVPSESGYADAIGQRKDEIAEPTPPEKVHSSDENNSSAESSQNPTAYSGGTEKGSPERDSKETRKPARGDEPFERWEKEEMERLLEQIRGHLVLYPTRFLEGEDVANNFLFNADRLLPLPIYD